MLLMFTYIILSTLACGYLDHSRGANFYFLGLKVSKSIVGIVYALVVALIILLYVEYSLELFLTVWIGFFIGTTTGWGSPLGAFLKGVDHNTDGEWWQKGILLENTGLALFVRGIIWAIPLAPLMFISPIIFLIFMLTLPVSMLLSAWLVRETYTGKLNHNGQEFSRYEMWKITETARGAMIGFLVSTSLVILTNF